MWLYGAKHHHRIQGSCSLRGIPSLAATRHHRAQGINHIVLQSLNTRFASEVSNPFLETSATPSSPVLQPQTRTFTRRIRPSRVLALNSEAGPSNVTLQQTGTQFGTPLEREIFSQSPLRSGLDRTMLLSAYVHISYLSNF